MAQKVVRVSLAEFMQDRAGFHELIKNSNIRLWVQYKTSTKHHATNFFFSPPPRWQGWLELRYEKRKERFRARALCPNDVLPDKVLNSLALPQVPPEAWRCAVIKRATQSFFTELESYIQQYGEFIEFIDQHHEPIATIEIRGDRVILARCDGAYYQDDLTLPDLKMILWYELAEQKHDLLEGAYYIQFEAPHTVQHDPS